MIATILQRLLSFALVLLVVAIVGFFTVAAPIADWRENKVTEMALPVPTDSAKALHARLLIVDMHADALLWPRNLARQSSHGHVDVPRLIAGHVALQVFGVVTKVPPGQNYEKNPSDKDRIGILAAASGWPFSAWTDLLARARVQSEKFQNFANASGGRLIPIRTVRDLDLFLRFRTRGDSDVVAGILAMEGLQALRGNLSRVDSLFDLGFRIGGLTHFFDNEVGGSSAGEIKGGITDFGREVVKRMEERGMIVDLAHGSPALIADVLAMAKKPVIVSHTGVQGICPGPRNLTDDALRAVAANDGVVGIGYWDAAVCDITPKGIAKSIRYATSVAGVTHVGLGSDFDGATTTGFDASQIIQITNALLEEGFTTSEVGAIMGGNALRVLHAGLPK